MNAEEILNDYYASTVPYYMVSENALLMLEQNGYSSEFLEKARELWGINANMVSELIRWQQENQYGTAEEYLTANAILNNAALVTETFTSASNNTTNMLCNYWIGKKDNDGLRSFLHRMMKTSILIHISLAAICILGAQIIVRAFHVKSELTFALAVTAISLYSLCMPFNAVNGIYRAYDLCIDRRKPAYILTVLNFLVMPVAAMLIISALCKPQNIWAAYVAGQG